MTIAAMSKVRTDPPQLPGDEPSRPQRTWSDENLAPAIDHDLLRALVRQELPEPKARAVYRLIHSFASWDAAHTQAVIAEHRRKQDGGES